MFGDVYDAFINRVEITLSVEGSWSNTIEFDCSYSEFIT